VDFSGVSRMALLKTVGGVVTFDSVTRSYTAPQISVLGALLTTRSHNVTVSDTSNFPDTTLGTKRSISSRRTPVAFLEGGIQAAGRSCRARISLRTRFLAPVHVSKDLVARNAVSPLLVLEV
jgi:hypothetical protein